MVFKDRFDAAQKLLPYLLKYKGADSTVILAIPRGSLQIGYELSHALQLPLDIIATKKIPAPMNEEYAIGSIDPDGIPLLNGEEVARYSISNTYLDGIKKSLLTAIQKRYTYYRGEEKIPSFRDKTVILVDDGIATGYTIKAAIAYLRRNGVSKLVVAVPVSAADSAKEIKNLVDELICLSTPLFFEAVGEFYEQFPQVSDEEARQFLQRAKL